nr:MULTISPECIES: translation initiation factor IF-2 N-terminal domain-containing protein [unclassified Corynebacterium]
MAESVRDFDRSQLGAKTRVHALAKMLGGTSKELVAALKELGWRKVAQSTLSPEEVTALLDHLGGTAASEDNGEDKSRAWTQKPAGAEKAESEERIRHRVEKNVANEIHQIEEKVEKDLSEQVAQSEEREAELPEVTDRTPREDDAPAPAGQEETSEEQDKPRGAKRGRTRRVTKKTVKADHESQAAETARTTPEEDAAPEVQSEEYPERQDQRDRAAGEEPEEDHDAGRPRRRHRRVTRRANATAARSEVAEEATRSADPEARPEEESTEESGRRRRGRRGTRRGRGEQESAQGTEVSRDPEVAAPEEPETEEIQEPVALKGSTRLEAQRRRRSERSDEARKKRHVISQAEFLARRESVQRTMVVRERDRQDHHGVVTQVGVLEDDLLVEHFVTSEQQTSMIGNIYLGRVQNVLPSMEAAFIDIGKGRNGVLYAGEVDWKAAGLGGRSRKIEQALRSGDQVLVQVTKDPVGHKGARLTTQISLAGRFLVYVPGGRSAGISRKLPAPERKRLKEILKEVVPNQGGAIIRTAAEGVSEEAIAADVRRLHDLWEDIQARAQEEKDSRGATPVTLYEEPNMLVKVVRDLFNEDFGALVVEGRRAWNIVHAYVHSVAPDLEDRLTYYDRAEHDGLDAFEAYRVDEQLHKALARMVWLPSGGSLVIDRTEAMTVIDVNTGRFTGSGGNLEETVTRNNLEAAEEVVRQLRLRDLGGMIVIDFIDMVLPENRDLVLRRLKEALERDRTRHQVSEVTSLGLVQLTRKRLGTGLLETFSTECPTCEGRGLLVHDDPVEHGAGEKAEKYAEADRKRKGGAKPTKEAAPEREPQRSIEELASAVVIEDSEEVSEVEKIAAAAVATADELDPHEPNGSHYEQAVAQFEASPRRGRRTRGNSRSDHRPRPEDFEASIPHDDRPDEAESAIRRRHRRRVVRRGAARAAAQASSVMQRTSARKQAEPQSHRVEQTEASAGLRRRGRRRATYRRA